MGGRGRIDEMDMEGDGEGVGRAWRAEAHRPLWAARSLGSHACLLPVGTPWRSLEYGGSIQP